MLSKLLIEFLVPCYHLAGGGGGGGGGVCCKALLAANFLFPLKSLKCFISETPLNSLSTSSRPFYWWGMKAPAEPSCKKDPAEPGF